jgi:hypothetical protein
MAPSSELAFGTSSVVVTGDRKILEHRVVW